MKWLIKVSRETIAVLLIIFVLCFNVTYIQAEVQDNIGVEGDSSIIIDAENGSIYNGVNIDEVHGIASITKLMTAYLTYEYIRDNDLSMDDTINISERAAQIKIEQPDASGVYLEANKRITYEQALNQLLILSDNGVAIALAEQVSGSEKEFVQLMNEKAVELGMNNTTFYNASGLSTYDYGSIMIEGIDKNSYNQSTSNDLAILAMRLYEDYPEVIDITQKPSYTVDGVEHATYNFLANPNSSFYYEGVKGLKTGFSIEAQNCFVGFYESKITGKKYISVILGTGSKPIAFNQSAYMYNWVDTQKYYNTIDQKDIWTVDLKGVSDGNGTQLSPSSNFSAINQQYIDAQVVEYNYNSKYFDEHDRLTTTIEPGEVVATVTLKGFSEEPIIDNVLYSSVNEETGEYTMTIDLVSRETISKQLVANDVFEATKQFFIGLFNEIT